MVKHGPLRVKNPKTGSLYRASFCQESLDENTAELKEVLLQSQVCLDVMCNIKHFTLRAGDWANVKRKNFNDVACGWNFDGKLLFVFVL